MILILNNFLGCSSLEKCPNNEEILKAGFYIHNALRLAKSNNESDIKTAKSIYQEWCKNYFKCCINNKNNLDEHCSKALIEACKYFNTNREEEEILLTKFEIIKRE